MIKYSVKYKKTGSLFWKRIKNITGDNLIQSPPMRIFDLKDKTRIEVTTNDMIFCFSSERSELLQYISDIQQKQQLINNQIQEEGNKIENIKFVEKKKKR